MSSYMIYIWNQVIHWIINVMNTLNSNNIIGVTTKLIIDSDAFALELKNKHVEIYLDIESYQQDIHCSCKKRIEKYISRNKKAIKQFVTNFYNNNIKLQATINRAIKQNTYVSLRGKVVTIHNSDKAWEKFYRKMVTDNCYFKGYSVVAAGNELKIYFV